MIIMPIKLMAIWMSGPPEYSLITRDIERGTRALQTLVSYSLYTIIPTLVELTFVLVLLGHRFDMGYVWITLAALVVYGVFTISITEWQSMPMDQKYTKAMLGRLKAGNPELQTPEGWKNFTRTTLVAARNKDFSRRGK